MTYGNKSLTSIELEERQTKQTEGQVIVLPIIVNDAGRDAHVVLIKKKRPDWQIGMLNGPGGKIELGGEQPWNAAHRELLEETGLQIMEGSRGENLIHVGTLRPREDLTVWFYTGRIGIHAALAANKPPAVDEEVVWLEIHEALKHPKLINNLRYLIPLSLAKLDGFKEAR